MSPPDVLAEFLNRRGLSQCEFAEQLGITAAAVSMWLSGVRRPGLTSALRLERATDGAVPASIWADSAPSIQSRPAQSRPAPTVRRQKASHKPSNAARRTGRAA